MAWAPDYATVSELKDYLRIDDTDDDTELGLVLTAASRAIDRAANRQFGVVASPEERIYESRWDRRRSKYVIETDDIMTSTGLVIEDSSGSAVAAADYTLYPRNAPQKTQPWTYFEVATATAAMTVTGTWGWTSVPDAIKTATLLQADRLFKRRDAPFGVAGSPDVGSELRLLARLDPDVEAMVGTYKRWWATA